MAKKQKCWSARRMKSKSKVNPRLGNTCNLLPQWPTATFCTKTCAWPTLTHRLMAANATPWFPYKLQRNSMIVIKIIVKCNKKTRFKALISQTDKTKNEGDPSAHTPPKLARHISNPTKFKRFQTRAFQKTLNSWSVLHSPAPHTNKLINWWKTIPQIITQSCSPR